MADAARIKKSCPRCQRSFEDGAAFCPIDGTELEPPSSQRPPDSDPYIGTVIHGDIEIRSVAGVGAMGRVYRAHQRGIDRDVAVKILHRELSGNLPLVQRFHREAKIASRLQHPHVVEVYLAGQLPDGALYIAMEFLDGMSLAAATKASAGMMTLERTLPIALQVCDAVGEGHARGVVHRDLKPENVMLVHRADTSDWVKVLDFGIAKVSLGEQSMETAAGLIFGTARYISPEGAQGATVGPPGDVYSIATMLYQLLAGRTPFEAEQPVGLLIKHIHDEPPMLGSWPPAAGVPAPIARVIMENLAKDPKQRAPNARAFGTALANAAKEAGVSFSDVGVVARMSMLDVGSSRKSLGPVEPTLDDAAAVAPPAVGLAVPSTATPVPTLPLARPVMTPEALADTTSDQPAPRAISTRPPYPSQGPESRGRHRKNTTFLILLAFMLGVALTALVMQYLAHRPDAEQVEHAAHIQKARRALANGNYTEPPGENVRDLVRAGAKRWPDDAELAKIQSDAAHELVTRAMAARSGGDVTGARELAKSATELDSTDGTARLLVAQYDDELTASSADGGGGGLAGVQVTLDVPIGRTRPGGRAELVAKITKGNGRAVTGAQFVVTGPGLATDGISLPASGDGPFKAVFSPPREGAYEVQFEANVEGATVRADRTLQVTR